MPMLSFLLARFSEPSSYAGLGAVLALAGLHFSDTDLGQIAQFLAAGCGLVALLLRERGMIQIIVLCLLLGGSLSACGPLATAGGGAGAVGGGLTIANQVTGAADTIQTACSQYQRGRAAAQANIGAGVVPASDQQGPGHRGVRRRCLRQLAPGRCNVHRDLAWRAGWPDQCAGQRRRRPDVGCVAKPHRKDRA